MMRQCDEEWSGFVMQDFQEFCGKFGASYMSSKLRSMFNFVPSSAFDGDDDDSTRWKVFADFVKPSAKVELIQIS